MFLSNECYTLRELYDILENDLEYSKGFNHNIQYKNNKYIL